jgi:hypothetical protein
VRITTSDASNIAVGGVRGNVNQRGEFLLAALLAVDETAPAPSKSVIPEVADGAGYPTQFVMYGSGNVDVHSQSGAGLNILNLK